jgi:hypothetical protein
MGEQSGYCSLVFSALACLKIGMAGSQCVKMQGETPSSSGSPAAIYSQNGTAMTYRLARLAIAIVALLCAAVETSYAQIVIHSATDLQGVSNNMAASYVLDANVDLSSIVNFIPIGMSASATDPIPFTGTLDGAGYSITGLTQVSSGRYAGLLGVIGTGGSIKNLRVQNAAITSNYGGGSAAMWSL